MTIDPAAFEYYRRSPNHKTTLPRLLLGTAIVVLFWVGTTLAVLLGGTYFFVVWQASSGAAPLAGGACRTSSRRAPEFSPRLPRSLESGSACGLQCAGSIANPCRP